MAPSSRSRLGRKGEEIAARFLQSIGYAIRDRNLRLGSDEIDILAHDPKDDCLVFAEVKTRAYSSNDYPPELNCHPKKKQSLKRAARAWVSRHCYERGYRMDLVCVVGNRVVNHLVELEWEH